MADLGEPRGKLFALYPKRKNIWDGAQRCEDS